MKKGKIALYLTVCIIVLLLLLLAGQVIGGLLGGEGPWWAFALLALGAALLLVEGIIPGFGILGCLGFALLVAAFLGGTEDVGQFMASLVSTAAACCVCMVCISRIVISCGFVDKITLEETIEAVAFPSKYGGKQGITLTPLHPSGVALVEGERLHVQTGDGYIEAGRPVVIVEESVNKITVVELEESARKC